MTALFLWICAAGFSSHIVFYNPVFIPDQTLKLHKCTTDCFSNRQFSTFDGTFSYRLGLKVQMASVCHVTMRFTPASTLSVYG